MRRRGRSVGKIATALADLHRQNVIHHDIKPSSIMFRESGEAVLIDYGLSHHNHLPDLLQEEFRLPYGTAPYMAPERLIGVRDDPRSDLFSLGVLLYFFTTGERPFGESETLRGDAAAAVARSASAALAQGRLSALAAGDRAALPGDRAGAALSDRLAARLRSRPSRPGQAHRALGAAEARSARATVWRRRFNQGVDAAEAEIRRRRANRLEPDRRGRARHGGRRRTS